MDKLAVMFPGQGIQYVEMGKNFYEKYDISKKTYEEANEVTGKNISKLCFEGSFSVLNDFINMQLCIVTTEIAMYRAYIEEYGVLPQFAIGHSIGEYAAFVAAGAIKFEDVLRILVKRGELIKDSQAYQQGRMDIVENISEERLNEILLREEGRVHISCFNSERQFAISDYNEKLDILEKILDAEGAKVTALFTSPPMHSVLLNEIAEEFYAFLKEFNYYPFLYPVMTNVNGCAFSNTDEISNVLTKQLYSPVKFSQALKKLPLYGIELTIEMSPKILLTNFISSNYKIKKELCYGVTKDRVALAETFQKEENYVKDIPDFIGQSLAILASCENRNNSNDTDIIEIYTRIREWYIAFKEGKWKKNKDIYEEIYDEVIRALYLKGFVAHEIKSITKGILDMTNMQYQLKDKWEKIEEVGNRLK